MSLQTDWVSTGRSAKCKILPQWVHWYYCYYVWHLYTMLRLLLHLKQGNKLKQNECYKLWCFMATVLPLNWHSPNYYYQRENKLFLSIYFHSSPKVTQHPKSKSVPTGTEITFKIKAVSYFSGKTMAEMCTVTVTTVEVIPTYWQYNMWRRVIKAGTDAQWGNRKISEEAQLIVCKKLFI